MKSIIEMVFVMEIPTIMTINVMHNLYRPDQIRISATIAPIMAPLY